MKKITKLFFMILIMIFAVPVFAADGVTVENIIGTTLNENVVLNATDSIDVAFNDLNQDASYKITLKNNTDEVIYVNDVVAENLSEEFIEFSLTDKSLNTMIEPGKENVVEVEVKTLDITHAGRNVNEEVTLKFLLGDSVVNPETDSNWIVYVILIGTLLITVSTMFSKLEKKKKLSIFVIGTLVLGTTVVSANDDNTLSLTGKVKYTSQNLLQESGTKLDGYRINYDNSLDIWKHAEQVKNIIISDDKTKPEEYDHKYDLTTTDSKRIYGYLVENGDKKTPYDLYIVSNGVIYAPANSTGLFSFPNLETIKGLEYIEFDNTTNMSAMFMNNVNLKSLNTSAINTSNVTNTSYMFNGCDNLNVSEKNFNLAKVTNKNYMFNQNLSDIVKKNAKSDKDVNFGADAVTGRYFIDSTKNDKNPVYYYRGAITNNNVLFGGYCWKMVRTTDTGGIKMIYNGIPSSSGSCNNSGENSHIQYSVYAQNTRSVNDLDYLNSNVRKVLDSWYKNKLLNYTNYIENTVWCNDKQMDSKDGSVTVFKPMARFYDVTSPTLSCSNEDSLSVNNGELTYPIGLLTADELGLAGVYRRNNLGTNYLDSNLSWWTMSAVQIDGSYSYMYRTSDEGHRLNFSSVDLYYRGIRPAISLKHDTEYVYGTGTVSNPYIIK